MSRPPRPMSATPLLSQARSGGADQQQQPLASFQDGYAHLHEDGEVHIGRHPNSVVYRKRKISSQPLGRTSPMVPDGRYSHLPKDFTFGMTNRKDSEHTDSVLHGWQENKKPQTEKHLFKKVAPGLESSVASQQRKKQRAASTSGVIIRGGKHMRTQLTDPSLMKVAGVSSGKGVAECRFSNAIGSAATPTAHHHQNNNSAGRQSPDRESNANTIMSNNSRYAASASNINVIGSGMNSLVAHDYRYAWVAQKLAEHEETVQRESSRRTMRASPVPSSVHHQHQQHHHYQMPTKRSNSAGPGGRRPTSASNPPSEAGNENFEDDEEYREYQQHMMMMQQQQQQQQGSTSVGGSVVGPSGRIVSHYPKLVNQRVAESNRRIYGDRVHPKEYFTLKQFKNIPSRVRGPSAHAFAGAGGAGGTVFQ